MSLRRSPRHFTLLLCLWCLATVAPGLAEGQTTATDDRRHEATVPVDNRDRPARQAGFERALDQVVVKLSGDRQVLRDPRLREIREQAGRYVQRFRYVDLGAGAHGLEVRFDGAALERLLAERGLPVWGAARPGLIVWMAVTRDGDRLMLGGGEGQELMDVLQRVAGQRGIRLIFPVMDMEDRSAVNFADLSGGFNEPVLRASERYSARQVVAAHVQRRGTGWSGRWRLLAQDFQEDRQTTGDTLEATLEEGMHELVDLLGRRLAIAGLLPAEDHVRVVVEGVNSLEAYQRARAHLSELSVVASLRPLALEPDRAVFLTQLRGSPRDLERGVRLGRVLEPSDAAGGSSVESGDMVNVILRLSR